jgi:hypothetical protein
MPIFYKFLKLVTKMVDIVMHTMIKSKVVNTKVPLSRKAGWRFIWKKNNYWNR